MPIVPTVNEKILREIVDRLEAYVPKKLEVYREVNDVEKMTPTDYQVVVKMLSNARVPTLDRIGNPPIIAYEMVVACYGQVVISETDPEPIEGHATELVGHIVKAITTGTSWYTFDGNAINSVVDEISVLGSTGYRSGQVSFRVMYRVPENDPFTAAI
jgi:hypothetical protein